MRPWKTDIDGDDVRHGKEGREASSNFSGKPGMLDLVILQGESARVAKAKIAATRRTCPEPSRRKILPKVDFPIKALKLSMAAWRASMAANE